MKVSNFMFCKSVIVCLFLKTIRANQVKGYFAHLDQHGTIAKHLTYGKFYFELTFSLQQPSWLPLLSVRGRSKEIWPKNTVITFQNFCDLSC